MIARVSIDSDDSVAFVGCRVGVGVPGGDVEQVPRRVEGWRGPDASAGWAVVLCAGQVNPRRLRFVLHDVGLPEPFSGRCGERDHAATESAAFVSRVSG